PAWLCAAVSDLVVYVLFFFFSSRRRHTRFSRDWSSDVCSSDLFATAFNGDVRLCVSHEFAQELKRSSVAQADDPILQFAESLPTLPLLEHADELMEALRSMIFPDRDENRARAVNDASDLRHLAACIRHGIRGFVTNEKAILRAGPKLY